LKSRRKSVAGRRHGRAGTDHARQCPDRYFSGSPSPGPRRSRSFSSSS
jgi:hypothetical protein